MSKDDQQEGVGDATMIRGIVLVGHGGVPTDYPPELVTQLKRLEAQRRVSGMPKSIEEQELDTKIRRWPRTATTDPYRFGLEAVAAALKPQLNGALFALAFNEFCAPTLEESVEELVKQGATSITVTTTMFTPGGSHSEVEIPAILDSLRLRHPGILLCYAWPFDLQLVAKTLVEQVSRFS
jgi:sirohydrochlorin cobaltochelatase